MTMRVLICRCLWIAAIFFYQGAASASPYEFHLQLDVRAVSVDSPLTSFAHGGSGLLRYDESHDGLQLGRALLDFNGPLTETIRAQITAGTYGDHDRNPLDVTEAYLEWRPYPISRWRWRAKLGVFYPPISLENRAMGWDSLYTISSSAINTWIGEEVRTVGTELSLSLMGAPVQRPYDLTAIVGVYEWNDPMGVLIFQRGWAIHDRQSGLFGELPRPFPQDPQHRTIDFFREIDHHVGYYAGVEAKAVNGFVVRYLHYDNNGDPARSDIHESAWRSRFDSVGARFEAMNFTFIAQGMQGDTAVGAGSDGQGLLAINYWSYFGLASYRRDKQRFTLRYDRMNTQPFRGAALFPSEQHAHAWTAAYLYDWNSRWQAIAETVRITGSLQQRSVDGVPPDAKENLVQLALRYTF